MLDSSGAYNKSETFKSDFPLSFEQLPRTPVANCNVQPTLASSSFDASPFSATNLFTRLVSSVHKEIPNTLVKLTWEAASNIYSSRQHPNLYASGVKAYPPVQNPFGNHHAHEDLFQWTGPTAFTHPVPHRSSFGAGYGQRPADQCQGWPIRDQSAIFNEKPTARHEFRSIFWHPKIDVEKYDGDPVKWPDYAAMFQDMVDSDPTQSLKGKLTWLKCSFSQEVRNKSASVC